MKEIRLEMNMKVVSLEELTENELNLIEVAKVATSQAYAPYSKFHVGAAVLLENGKIVSGSNQENIAYPSGMCAERVVLFHANHQYPFIPIMMLAIAAKEGDVFVEKISPCGACRQVLLETEKRYGKPIKLLLYGREETLVIESAASLLPLCFEAKELKIR